MAKAKMCSYSGGMTKVYARKDIPGHVRCPECGRRLKPRLYDSHFNTPYSRPDWYYTIPVHKIKGWWKKKKLK